MAYEEITETADAQLQIDKFNRASSMIKRTQYSPSPGDAWMVVGVVLADVATTEDIPTLVSDFGALSEISSVVSPQVWGQTPATLEANPEPPEDPIYRLDLHVSGALGGTRGFTAAKAFNFSARYSKVKTLPVGKKWLVFNCLLPAELANEAAYDALVAAVTGVTGVTTCVPIVWGVVPSDMSGVSLNVETRMRINTIPAVE